MVTLGFHSGSALQLGSSSEVKKGSSEAQHCKEEKKERKTGRQTDRKKDGQTEGRNRKTWDREISFASQHCI